MQAVKRGWLRMGGRGGKKRKIEEEGWQNVRWQKKEYAPNRERELASIGRFRIWGAPAVVLYCRWRKEGREGKRKERKRSGPG